MTPTQSKSVRSEMVREVSGPSIRRRSLEVSGEILERADPVFISDPMTAALKALPTPRPH